MKVAVIGSRSLNVDIEKYMPKSTSLIITGGARGIDSLAERYADLHGIPKKVLVPDYSKYGRSAPVERLDTHYAHTAGSHEWGSCSRAS